MQSGSISIIVHCPETSINIRLHEKRGSPVQGYDYNTSLELLQKFCLVNRIHTVTTDNTSNNSTLIESLQESIDELDLLNLGFIVRIPYLAYMI